MEAGRLAQTIDRLQDRVDLELIGVDFFLGQPAGVRPLDVDRTQVRVGVTDLGHVTTGADDEHVILVAHRAELVVVGTIALDEVVHAGKDTPVGGSALVRIDEVGVGGIVSVFVPKRGPNRQDPKDKTEIAEAVRNERFFTRIRCCRSFEPEPDQ